MSRFRKILKVLEIVAKVLTCILLLYIVVCYGDVLAHNLSGGTTSWWNFFVIMANGGR